jgi:hypothetical protein
MIKILGIFLFFGLTGLILWAFSEMLWRADDEQGSDPCPPEVEADQDSEVACGEEIETTSAPRTAHSS